MSQRISDSPHMLYPAFASREMLEWLASWSDMDNRAVWNREQMIYLLENGSRLYAIRGTKNIWKKWFGYIRDMFLISWNIIRLTNTGQTGKRHCCWSGYMVKMHMS